MIKLKKNISSLKKKKKTRANPKPRQGFQTRNPLNYRP